MRILLCLALLSLLLFPACGGSPGDSSKKSAKKKSGKKKRKGKKNAKSKKAPASALKALREENPNLARHIEKQIAKLGGKDPEASRAAADELVLVGKDVVLPMVDLLEDSREQIRVLALMVLNEVPDKRATVALCKCFGDSSGEVRQAAAYALGAIRDPESLPALFKAFDDSDCTVRNEVICTLGEFRDQKALPTLEKAEKDSDTDVRGQVYYAYQKILGDKAIPRLLKGLKDPEEEVRDSAVQAIGMLKSLKGIKALESLLNERSQENIYHETVVEAMAKGGSLALEALLRALKTEKDGGALNRICEALGKLKDARAVKPLCESLKKGNRHAGSALAEIGEKSIRYLIELLKEENASVKMQAHMYLKRITGKDFGREYDPWASWYEFK